MATIEERFQAAVNVIKGLPKNGPYQPSNTMMLKFYGYYKQAVEGPCNQKKPGFWDIVGRAKWEAWNDNRNLTREQAMTRYVESLREIIETMSFTENVQNFVGSLDGLDISLSDLDAVAPGMREVAETHPDSPFNSRACSPQCGSRTNSIDSSVENELEHVSNNATTATTANGHLSNGILHAEENGLMSVTTSTLPTLEHMSTLVDQSDDEYGDPFDFQREFQDSLAQQTQALQQINLAVKLVNADLVALNRRNSDMEVMLREMRLQLQVLCKFNSPTDIRGKLNRKQLSWWPFNGISPTWFAILILWPFAIKLLKRMLITTTTRRQ